MRAGWRITRKVPNQKIHLTVKSVSGQREPQLPSAHRTVRTGPYTAPHARRIH